MAASTPSTTDAQPAQHPSMVESAPLRETPAQQRDAAQRWLILGAHTRELIRSQSFDLDAPQRRRLETEKELEQLAEEEEDLNQKLRKVQQRSRAAHNTLHNTLGTSSLLHRAQEVIEEQEQALDHAKAVAMALHDGDNELAINRLRDVLIASGDCQRKTTSMLSELVKQGLPTSRTHFLKALTDIVKPTGRRWDDPEQGEWARLVLDGLLHGDIRTQGKLADLLEEDDVRTYEDEAAAVAWVRDKFPPAVALVNCGGADSLTQQGWAKEPAETFRVLEVFGKAAISRALKQHDSRFAASSFAMVSALIARKRQNDSEREHTAQGTAVTSPKLYINLMGERGLTALDPSWLNIERPDNTGFRGLTCHALITADCRREKWSSEGITTSEINRDTGERVFKPVDSDIVCFESGSSDAGGEHHAAIMISSRNGAFPPNTLFKLKGVHEKGFYPETEKGERITVKGGAAKLFVRRRLLTVTATYKVLPSDIRSRCEGTAKHCGSTRTLVYGTRASYIAGNEEILGKPVLTMEQECQRAWEFEDWKGVKYRLDSEWQYVSGVAKQKEDCTAGVRDNGNEGKTVDDFVDQINSHIEERRRLGHGRELPTEFAYMTRDEVLAVRLFSGPSYQLLNGFLRQVSLLDPTHRAILANDPETTFAATVGHICRAIRKLSAIALPSETRQELYRAVRGQLPRSFWLRDEAGMICACDMGFMSTSTRRTTPLDYMAEGQGKDDVHNLLWVIRAKRESASGFHYGADISHLSQFQQEAEVLFPPCTMLTVIESIEADDASRAEAVGKGGCEDEATRLQGRLSRHSTATKLLEAAPDGASPALANPRLDSDENTRDASRAPGYSKYRGTQEAAKDGRQREKHFLQVCCEVSFV